MEGGDGAYHPRTPDDVFVDYKGRRAAMIKALTTEVEKFFHLCDPGGSLGFFALSLSLPSTMAAVSDLILGCGCDLRPARLSLAPVAAFNLRRRSVKVLRPSYGGYEHHNGRLFLNPSRLKVSKDLTRFRTHMALVDDRVIHQSSVATSNNVLAYDLIQGSQVSQKSVIGKPPTDLPTAVLLHGILGSRKNWGSFAKRLAQEFPLWQFLLVDLRCHGDSASIKKYGPHTVASTALDVLKLVGQLRLTPRVLVGHSFGGKVALSMMDQAAKPLARPVRVWVLDSTPGKVRPGGDGEDHPGELIEFLSRLPKQISSKQDVVNSLVREGFSMDVARWVVTNLRPINRPRSSSSPGFSWIFDLKGISEMFKSYEATNLWKIVENVPRGVHVNFLKAERSLHRWTLEDLQRIHAAEEVASDEGAGVEMHLLEDAGHWVHADNPDGLFKILSKSFRYRPNQ